MNPAIHKGVCFALMILFLGFGNPTVSADTFYGDVPTGLMQLPDSQHPVYLYVPQNYKANRAYPLLIALGEEGTSAEDTINFWLKLAKRRNMIVLSPSSLWIQDYPDNTDKWLLNVKEAVASRYNIAKSKTYLVGLGSGAHYAAYLGVRYPREFSGVGLLKGAWSGKFAELIHPKKTPDRQLPFYVAVDPASRVAAQSNLERANELESFGYPVLMKEIAANEDLVTSNARTELLDWLEDKSQSWIVVQEQYEQTLVGKTKKIMKGLVSV